MRARERDLALSLREPPKIKLYIPKFPKDNRFHYHSRTTHYARTSCYITLTLRGNEIQDEIRYLMFSILYEKQKTYFKKVLEVLPKRERRPPSPRRYCLTVDSVALTNNRWSWDRREGEKGARVWSLKSKMREREK